VTWSLELPSYQCTNLPTSADQFVIVTVRLAVASVVPLEFRTVIVNVAVAVLSARICHETLRVPPAAIVATDCVELDGLFSRNELLGVKLTTTDRPLAAALPVFATAAVAVNDCPRRMVAGTPLSETVTDAGGCVEPGNTVRFADRVVLPWTAVIVTGVFAKTVDVVTVKLAWLWPAGTVTAGGTCAAEGLLVESDTDVPPAGAAPLRTTMPPTLAPPVTLPAPSVTELE